MSVAPIYFDGEHGVVGPGHIGLPLAFDDEDKACDGDPNNTVGRNY
jgi:hypothetical protein